MKSNKRRRLLKRRRGGEIKGKVKTRNNVQEIAEQKTKTNKTQKRTERANKIK